MAVTPKRQRRSLGSLAVAAGVVCSTNVVACTEPTGLELATAPIQTSDTHYQFAESGETLRVDIGYEFTNPLDSPIYVVGCGQAFGFQLERLEGSAWVPRWSPILAACLTPPFVIEPGESLSGTFRIWGARLGSDREPQFDVADPSGTYRIVITAALSSFQPKVPFGPPIPLAARTSNVFTLETP